jgi:hypothetical protein
MPNLNVKLRLEKLNNDATILVKHIVQYSGISSKDAGYIDRLAGDLCQIAAQLSAIARAEMGNPSAEDVERDVRRALGFTHP